MSNFYNISTGQTLSECDFYDYVTAITYDCCTANQGVWISDNIARTEYEWQLFLNANPPVCACIAPTFTTAVAIDGDSIVGGTLSVSDNGQPSGTAPITITYQWNLNGTPIGGATADTYEVQPADAGGNITCTVTATNACGSVVENSNTIVIT